MGERRTTLPNHTTGDLLEYARHNRENSVLKPNRAYGGEGVAIGALDRPKRNGSSCFMRRR